MKLLDIDLIYEKYDKWLKDKDDVLLTDIASECYDTYHEASRVTLVDIINKIDENINFYRGNHWLYYDSGVSRYKPFPKTDYSRKIPQSTTNYIGAEVEAIVSLLTRTKENILVVPNSNDAEDINKAKIGEAILEGHYYLNNELYNKILFVKTAVLCGTAYRKDFFDGSMVTYDKDNNPIMGDINTKILSPLDIIPDFQNAIRDINDGRYIIEFGFHPVSVVKSMFKKKEKGFTGKSGKVEEDTSTNVQLDYLQMLKSPDGDDKSPKKFTILLEIYVKPTAEHKKGLMIICTNKEVLYIDENKMYNQFGGRFWSPYTMLRYVRDPMSHYGKSLPEIIIPLNKDINKIDSLIMLNRATMAIPRVLIPIGSMIPGQSIDGTPGQEIHYKPGLGEKPTFEYGKGLDQSVLQERQQKVQDISRLSGSNEVLQGVRPQGVSTAAGLNLLLEQSYSKFNNTTFELEFALSSAYTKVLNLIRNCFNGPREDYVNRIKALNNSVTKVAIKDFFEGTDLGNNIDVRVEAGSTSPKSLVMEQNNIKEIAQMGVFGALDPLQNPIGNKYFLNKFGLSKFSTPTNNDTTRATWENDLIRNGKFEEVQVMPVDNNIIHYKVLNEEIKKPDFYDNNPEEVVQYYWKHLCEHFQAMMPEQYMMIEISPQQINELDMMSINLGVIGEQELMMKRNPMAMIGQDPNMQAVPPESGAMPNDSMGGEQMQQIPPEMV